MSDKTNFVNWLNKKLQELNTDESVFGSYILSILEGDEAREEKRESIEGILSAIIETDLDKVVGEITDEWEKCAPTPADEPKAIEDVDTKLAKLLENQQIATTKQRQYTEEELRIREQILSQYSQVEYEDGYDEENEHGAGTSANNNDPPLIKNTNAADVAALAKERREQAKLESKAKKEKDREDREKQKQLREEKKEKRKTVKGERRR